jgi:hypothetical protein
VEADRENTGPIISTNIELQIRAQVCPSTVCSVSNGNSM